MSSGPMPMAVDRDWSAEISGTFERIQRPLRWPMEDFRRRKIANQGFVGYRFSRGPRTGTAGFAFGFALQPGVLPGVTAPPEAVAYAFARPVNSPLYRDLVERDRSPVRQLVAASRGLGFPFELHLGREVAAIRHRSVAAIPPELFVHATSDFFMIAQQPLRAGGFIERVKQATPTGGP